MIVKTYGLFWRRDWVYWGKQHDAAELLGEIEVKTKMVVTNLWEQSGVYALYDHYKLVYIGKADKTDLGVRLRKHCQEKAGRWDTFSWFGVRQVNQNGSLADVGHGNRQFTSAELIGSLEAILIQITDPPLNRRYEDIKQATLIEQKRSDKAALSDHELIRRIADHLGLQQKHIKD